MLHPLFCTWSGIITAAASLILSISPLSSHAEPSPAAARAEAGAPIEIHRLQGKVTLDGRSDEPAWEGVEPLPMVMQLPSFGAEPSERTEVLLAYDDEYFYLAARCFDNEPEGIHATTMKRDDEAENSDCLGLVLDTFNDNENALSFVTTPTGSRIDKTIYGDMIQSGGAATSWDAFWEVETVITGRGWFAEMRIPFSSLRFQEREGRVVMGCTVYRWIARKDERIVFPAIPQDWGSRSHLKPSRSRDIVL
ncbi:MAG: carbohydrate binding family 9 domain-containing protein, partial [Candidatus Latescibacterota bacterium]